jgi:hypothetical protein
LTARTLDLMHFLITFYSISAHSFLSNTQIKLHSNFATFFRPKLENMVHSKNAQKSRQFPPCHNPMIKWDIIHNLICCKINGNIAQAFVTILAKAQEEI